MASSIDATKPTAGTALTADVRNNFAAAKSEIEALQAADATLAPKASPTFTGTVTLPAGQVVNGVTLSTAQGTSNFLRGDGTYAAPAGGSPAGSGSELQYRNAGAFGAVTSSSVSGANVTFGGRVVAGSAAVTSSSSTTGYFGATYYNGTNLTALITGGGYIQFTNQNIDFYVTPTTAGGTYSAGNLVLNLSNSTGATFSQSTGVNGSSFGIASGSKIQFASTTNWYGSPDVALARNAAGVIEVNSTAAGTFRDLKARRYLVDATNTAAGTTGAQTINKAAGTVNFAAGATSLVVTNSLVTTSSLVFCTIRTNDATAVIKNVVPAAGSFTINLNAAATAETSVGFYVIN